jgi:hypothetical protein
MVGNESSESRRQSVFISHAGPDAQAAERLATVLEAVGIRARLDRREIKLGDNIVTWMSDAIAESDYLLILLSPATKDRYWVRTEWSNALAKEADLRRTFVIPVILPGLEDDAIPALLRARLHLDLRHDEEAAVLSLVARVKDDALSARDLGRPPTPAPGNLQESVVPPASETAEDLEVIVHSNRFGRSFKLRVPREATPAYLLQKLRDGLGLSFGNTDEKVQVRLDYTYSLRSSGVGLPLNRTLAESGVKHGDRLELWIAVTLSDLLENGEKKSGDPLILFRHAKTSMPFEPSKPRTFTSSDIARLASRFFLHVDQ